MFCALIKHAGSKEYTKKEFKRKRGINATGSQETNSISSSNSILFPLKKVIIITLNSDKTVSQFVTNQS